MKTSTIIASLAAILPSLAAPTARQATYAFSAIAIAIDADIESSGYGAINASESSFWLNRTTSTYCPPVANLTCSSQTATLFIGGQSTNTVYLDTEVAGGQQVYVASNGLLSYTVPHSAFMGNGSVTDGFAIDEHGQLQFQEDDFLACPVGAAYRVYAAAAATNVSSACLGFEFITHESAGPAAYEYA